jgi:cold shock protein
MKTGIVKFFNEGKGFGFIKIDGENTEVMVHISGLQDPIQQNDKVKFEVQKGGKGEIAVNVALV